MSRPRAAEAVEALVPAFARWLRRRGLSRRPVGNAGSRVRRVSIAYGDLAALGQDGALGDLWTALRQFDAFLADDR